MTAVAACLSLRRQRTQAKTPNNPQPIKPVIMASRSRFGTWSLPAGLLLAVLVWAGTMAAQAQSQTPADPLYTVSGIAVDVSDTNASRAKLQAISQAQVKAFAVLLDRLGGVQASAPLQNLSPAVIGRLMASLSIEEERTGPGRYIGRFTIRFLPDKVRKVLAEVGVAYTEDRAPSIVVIPVWFGPDGPEVWSNNPWRAGWLALNAHDTLVPLVIPLGDLTDSHTLSAEQALDGSQRELDAIRARYAAEAIIVAVAAPLGDTTIRATVVGDTPLGRVDFDEVHTANEGGVGAAAEQVVRHLHSAMVAKWRTSQARPGPASGTVQSLPVAVPFSTLEQWNGIRSRLVRTPGVTGVDLSSLSGQGAIVRLSYSVPFSDLQAELAARQLNLALMGETWVLRPF
jgi:hypothetical protein